MLLITLALAALQGLESIPRTPYDRVIELETTAEDPVLIEGKGPCVVLEYEVQFEGTLHVWAESELDLALRVDETQGWLTLGEEHESRYLEIRVTTGMSLLVLVAGVTPETLGRLELHVIASPESGETLRAASEGRHDLAEARRLIREGQREEAGSILRERVKRLIATEGVASSPAVVDVLWKIGDLTREIGLLDESLAALQTTLVHLERTHPVDHPVLLRAWPHMGATLRQLGRGIEAHAIAERILTARRKTMPSDDPLVLNAMENLAVSKQDIGETAGARVLLERVLAIQERRFSPDDPRLVLTRQNLAVPCKLLGDLDRALELEESVLASRERTLAEDHLSLIKAKQNLAVTRLAMGDVQGGHDLCEQVFAARERLLPQNHADRLGAAMNLATAKAYLGDLEGARNMEQRVLAAWEKLVPLEHPWLSDLRQNLATTSKRLGDLDLALELEKQVLAARRSLPLDHPFVLRAKANLLSTHLLRADRHEIPGAVYSVLESQLALAQGLRSESPRVARAIVFGERRRLFLAIQATEALPPDVRRPLDSMLFGVLESLRCVSTSSVEVARALAGSSELALLRRRLTNAGGALNDLSLACPEQESRIEAWRRDLVKLANERDRLERELRARLALRGVSTESSSSRVVGDGLENDAALVSYFRCRRPQLPYSKAAKTPPIDHLMAFVLTPDGSVHRVELGPCDRLERLVSRWRALLDRPIERGVVALDEEGNERAVGEALRAAILDPCLVALEDRPPATLHVIPDDFLHLVPFDALPGEQGTRVGDALPIRLEVSVQRLATPPARTSAAGGLVALGDVDFDASGIEPPVLRLPISPPPSEGGVERRGMPGSFAALLQSRFEVETVGVLYRETFAGEPLLLTRENASKKALAEASGEARFLHVATHGWFAPETIRSMSDASTEDASDILSRAQKTLYGFAPETLCGLALAGANHGANELGEVPGILTAEELATLDLSHCELAVLSACETNVGIRRAGQGIQSLQTALHAAGARTAITSLWRVDDAVTRRLMEHFYTNLWVEGMGKADALWQAKVAMREAGHPVRDSAGWVLTGDPD